MSFFGFERKELEKEKQRFLQRNVADEPEDVPVFTWGEESYDGLGDCLQEGGDELNEETFGSVGTIGKDFDFSDAALPRFGDASKEQAITPLHLARKNLSNVHQDPPSLGSDELFSFSNQTAESRWPDNPPFSALPSRNGNFIQSNEHSSVPPISTTVHAQESGNLEPRGIYTGVHTVEEIESEMRAAAQQSREHRDTFLQHQWQYEDDERQRSQHDQELQYQINHQQQEQNQLYVQRLLQQQREYQHQRATPPRMMSLSQSPRFAEQNRQNLLLQQQQRVQDLQERLVLEEMERQLLARAATHQHHRQSPALTASHHRQPSSLPTGDPYPHQQPQPLSRSPANGDQRYPAILQDGLAFSTPQNIQLQQRLLSEMAQVEFIRNMQSNNVQGISSPAEQEAVRMEAMRKILEAERMEEKRRRKAAKIAHMSRYNDLMTQSDKDFITRIQVSQLVTQDPYADDFYAQVYGAILRSRMGLQHQDDRVLKFGSGGGVGLGLNGPKGNSRRPSAMQRMEQQVERIVTNARKREEEKGLYALQSLQGALGKTSGRSYKAAPRQLLQVDVSSGAPSTVPHAHTLKEWNHTARDGAEEAAKLGREALGSAADTTDLIRKAPLTQREILTILEQLYDIVLQVEQLRRDHPSDDDQRIVEGQQQYDAFVDQLWDTLRVMVPLETSDPHPFISLLIPSKGKKLLPRITRHLSNQRMLTLLILLVACFNQLDVVRQASPLDYIQDTPECSEAERQTQAFFSGVLQSILPVVATANLRLITGLFGLLLDRSNVVEIAQTRPGLALFTMFLSRVELIKLDTSTSSQDPEVPTTEEVQRWQLVFDHFFQSLAPHFLLLFPSTCMTGGAQTSPPQVDLLDRPVWQFFAALALPAMSEQQHILVTMLREKILENVLSVHKGWGRDDDERQTKLSNVNLLLNALGLDSSQITL